MLKIKKIKSKALEYCIFPILVIFCVVAYFAVFNFRLYEISESDTAQSDAVQSDSADMLPFITDTKCAKETDGKIGIYDCYGNLEYTVDADITFLPHSDRLALSQGVVFDSQSELYEFIESLDS